MRNFKYCKSCGGMGVLVLDYSKVCFCKNCFQKLLFKRVSGFFTKNDLIDSKKSTVVLINDSSTGFFFLKSFFKIKFGKTPLKVKILKRFNSKTKADLIIFPTTLTTASSVFLKSVFDNNPEILIKPIMEIDGFKIIRPLITIPNSDLIKWAEVFKKPLVFEDLGNEKEFIEFVKSLRPMVEFSFFKFLEKL